jgi:mycothiol S-conjugate amidase
MTELCLLTVHAHPDDESSKGAPTVAKYRRENVRSVLVCCTGGEEGDLQNPSLALEGGPFHGMEAADVKAKLAHMRPGELQAAVEAIGFTDVYMLGYRDSGMADTEPNNHPDSFNMAPIDEATERLVAIIRETRPQVVLTYGDEQAFYPHPDHIRVHEISLLAFERAGDPTWYPNAGEPWQPLKLYYTVWSRARLLAWHERFKELGLESPYGEHWFERPSHDEQVTTRISISESDWAARNAALMAHATQVNPEEKFWFGLPMADQLAAYPYEDWMLARSLVSAPGPGVVEDDLFAGVRTSSAMR